MSRMTPLVREFMSTGRVADCPVIDMHTHPDRFHSIYFPDPEMDGILRTMDRAGITQIAAAPHVALADPIDGNDYMLKMVAAHPDRFLGYWCFNPHYPETLAAAQACLTTTPGMIGFKVHPGWAQYPLHGEKYQEMFAFADAHRLLVLSHTWSGNICNTAACRTVAEKYPNMTLLCGHSCYGEWDEAIALARECPNVYLELTAAMFAPGFIERAVRGAVAEKIVYGTDLPWFDPFYCIGCVIFADIDDADRHAILHGNAERLLASLATREITTS